MHGMLVLVAMSIGGGIGWWLGGFIGIAGSVFFSGIGTGIGVYVMRKIIKNAMG